jgi:hypothetical protein
MEHEKQIIVATLCRKLFVYYKDFKMTSATVQLGLPKSSTGTALEIANKIVLLA